jgi:hypothetical protein
MQLSPQVKQKDSLEARPAGTVAPSRTAAAEGDDRLIRSISAQLGGDDDLDFACHLIGTMHDFLRRL